MAFRNGNGIFLQKSPIALVFFIWCNDISLEPEHQFFLGSCNGFEGNSKVTQEAQEMLHGLAILTSLKQRHCLYSHVSCKMKKCHCNLCIKAK